MEDDREKAITKEQAMSLDEFVDSLFDSARDPKKIDLSVQRADGHVTQIEVIHVDRKVRAKMDDVEMGIFEEYNQQGYKCRFKQKNRPHIRNGLTLNEAIMKSICDHPLVYFRDAWLQL